MRQAYTPACLISFFSRSFARDPRDGRPWRRHHMLRQSVHSRISCFFLVVLFSPSLLVAQSPKPTAPANAASPLTTERAMDLAQQGRCKEALPALKRALSGTTASSDTKKNAGVLGVRCAMTLDDRDAVADFLRQLRKQFPQDPDVLFLTVHVYSDLSTRTAQDLGRFAPQSIPAHKLYAEALETQGKWGDAQHEYETMIAKEPNTPGLHFLLGRLLLSRPDAGADAAQRAKQEFQKEIEIDPKNAGAHYVLGELARRDENWDDAVIQFSQAAKLDSGFAEAYLGWGSCLVSAKRYEEAIAPLRAAIRLMPGNPSVHFDLATALSHTGQKEEAEKEFAIHRSLTATTPAPPGAEKPQ
jgi:Tfp pilus assembly protein PilF